MDGTADRVVRFLLDRARCTDCGSSYRSENVHILDNHGERQWDLAAVCHECQTLSFIRAIVRGPVDDDAVEIEGYSELTAAETRHFAELPPVDEDDVLDVVGFLSGFDGDFRGLFGQESDEP